MIKFWMNEFESGLGSTLVHDRLFLHTDMVNILSVRFSDVRIDMNFLSKGYKT